eukprot:2511209-Rhodomonas_salina.2
MPHYRFDIQPHLRHEWRPTCAVSVEMRPELLSVLLLAAAQVSLARAIPTKMEAKKEGIKQEQQEQRCGRTWSVPLFTFRLRI